MLLCSILLFFSSNGKYLFVDTRDSSNYSKGVLYCFNSESGAILWTAVYDRGLGALKKSPLYSGLALSDELECVVVADRGRVFVFKMSTGEKICEVSDKPLKLTFSRLFVSGKYLLAYVLPSTAFFGDLSNPSEWWTAKRFLKPLAVSADGRALILFPARIGGKLVSCANLTCVDREGKVLWWTVPYFLCKNVGAERPGPVVVNPGFTRIIIPCIVTDPKTKSWIIKKVLILNADRKIVNQVELKSNEIKSISMLTEVR